MHEGVDESLRKICKYQQNVPQHYYLYDTLVYFNKQKREMGFLTFGYYDNSDKLGLHTALTRVSYTLLSSSFPFVQNVFPCVTTVLSCLWVWFFVEIFSPIF